MTQSTGWRWLVTAALLTLAVRNAGAEDLTVTVEDFRLGLGGLPALSGDGLTLALPLITQDKDGPDKAHRSCVTFVVRLVPVGQTEGGEDIKLPRVCGHSEIRSIFNPGKTFADAVAPAAAARKALEKPLAELTQRLRAGKYQELPEFYTGYVNGPHRGIDGLLIDLHWTAKRKPTIVISVGKKKLASSNKAWSKTVFSGREVWWENEGDQAVIVRGKPDLVYARINWSVAADSNVPKERQDIWVAVKVKGLPPYVPPPATPK